MKQIITFLAVSFAFLSCKKEENLDKQIDEIIEGKNATVGVYALNPINGKTFGLNEDELFPLQSVFKFHVAAKVLSQVDAGALKLNDRIPIKASQLLPDTWSPLRDEHGQKDMTMQLDSIVYYMVSQSDNNACDILLDLVGGPATVQAYFDSLGTKNLQIEVNEQQMQSAWNEQFRNVSTPKSVTNSLQEFYLRNFLSGDSHNFLYGIMSNSTTGKNRIKAGVPEGTSVAHKTGTSGRNEKGISAATNDMGFVVLPSGKTLILCIFVSNSSESDETNEKLIADITKTLVQSSLID